MLREKLRNKKGFTLIEIIVVIVILAVLMAVAVPSVMSYMNEGNKAKYETVARAALINTQTAVAKDYADNGETDNAGSVIKWVEGNDKNGTTDITADFGSKKSYGSNVAVKVGDIKLSGADSKADNDVVSAKYYITLNSNADSPDYREVNVTVNGKMTVSTSAPSSLTSATGYTYTPASGH